MNGEWIRPKDEVMFHFMENGRKQFLCGAAWKSGGARNMFASYSRKCEDCLLRMVQREREEQAE